MPNKNSIDKILGATQVGSDPLTNIDLEIMNTLKQMFEEAKRDQGYSGSFEDYQKSLSVDDLKRIDIAAGGRVKKS